MNNAFVINLDSKKEEFDKVYQAFLPYGITCERFSAMLHPKKGVGATLSFLSLIARAKKENWPWVMILEDDTVPREKMKEWPAISKFLSDHQEQWDLFLGGTSHVLPTKFKNDFKSKTPLDIIECKQAFLVHFAIFNKSSYDKMLAWHDLPLPLEERPIVDGFTQQCDFRIWVPSPSVAWQKIHNNCDYRTSLANADYRLQCFSQKIKASWKYRFFGRWLKTVALG